MNISKSTISVCPVCYAEIPAIIDVAPDGVVMKKRCQEHGIFSGLVEKDSIFYMLTEMQASPTIYEALLVPVTDRCNTRCKYCFCPAEGWKEDPHAAEIELAAQCAVQASMPLILTGGEPTARDDLPELIDSLPGEVFTLSNGLRMDDEPDYLDRLLKTKLRQPDGVFRVGLSLHHAMPENLKRQEAVIARTIAEGLKLDSLMFTVDTLMDLDRVMELIARYQGHYLTARIHAAADIWGTGGTPEKLFVSDMYQHLYDRAKERGDQYGMLLHLNSKSVFFNVEYNGQHIMLCSWPDRSNIDLKALNCGPYIVGEDGKFRHLMYGYIRNELEQKNRIDVHVLKSEKNFPWIAECLQSLRVEPVNVHLLEGIPGDIGGARAAGFRKGTAEFVAFVDDDDVVVPGIFRKCLEMLDAHPEAAGVYTDEEIIDEQGNVLCQGITLAPALYEEWLEMLEHPCDPSKHFHHMVVLRRRFVEPYLDELAKHHRIAEPFLLAKVAAHGDLLHVPSLGYRYRMHAENTFTTYTEAEKTEAVAELKDLRAAIRNAKGGA